MNGTVDGSIAIWRKDPCLIICGINEFNQFFEFVVIREEFENRTDGD